MGTLVYRYGLRPPTLNGEAVEQQMRDGHRYYNQLIEIERDRRAAARLEMSRHPEIEHLEAWREALLDDRAEARKAIKGARKATRSRSETKEMRARVQDLTAVLQVVSAQLKEARLLLKEDLGHIRRLKEIGEAANARVRAARADCGVYWGTYLLAEAAADQAAKTARYEPSFRRWTGHGAVGVQLQGGLEADSLPLSGDKRLKLALPPADAWERRRDKRQRTVVRLRIGTYPDRGPIWAEWPCLMHRPLPAGAVIKWAKVIRERIECHDRWSLHLTLDCPPSKAGQAPEGTKVAVDIGWRATEEGLRIAYLWDGQEGTKVHLEPRVISGLAQVDDLRSIRDKRFNQAIEVLAAWLDGADKSSLPSELTEKAKRLRTWRSQARLAAVTLWWRENRFEGDEIYDQMEAWRKKDKHLWLWEANLRDKLLARRKDQYRVLASQLARKYRTLVLETFDLRDMQRLAPVESDSHENRTARSHRTMAALSVLREALVHAFAGRRGTVIEVPAANTTRTCHACGAIEEGWDQAADLEHRCTACWEIWDQDANAARVLYAIGERSSGNGKKEGVKVKDYAEVEEKESKWGKLGRHRSQNGGQASEIVDG
jgi:hypothetical protein